MKIILTAIVCFFSTTAISAQAFLEKDSLKVKVLRVIDADTCMVQYRKDVFNVRLRTANPKDSIDTWDKGLRQARKQSARYGISVDSVRTLGKMAFAFMDSLLTDKYVVLRRFPDQTLPGKQWSYNRLLRGVEYKGVPVGEIIPKIYIAK